MRERDFQASIVQAARLLGWHEYWTWNSLHSPAGWPDLVLLKDGKALAYECKTEHGKPTAAQLECLDLLRAAGIPARIVRPADLDDILAELADDRPPPDACAAGCRWIAQLEGRADDEH